MLKDLPELSKALRQNRSGSPVLWTLLGAAIGIGLLFAATRKLDYRELTATLRSTELMWVIGVSALTISFIGIKAWRWGLLLRFASDVNFRTLHSAIYVGLAVNFLVAHLGELARTSMVSRRHGISFGAILASVFVERVLDFVALLALLALFAVVTPDVPDLISTAAKVAMMFVAAAIVGLYAFLQPPLWMLGLARRVNNCLTGSFTTWIQHQSERMTLGLQSLRNAPLMIGAVILSIVQWSIVITAIWWSAQAVGETPSLTAAVVTFVLIVIGLTLPNSPMQIGTTQLAFTIGFGLDDISSAAAIAASLIYTAFLIVPIMIIGASIMLNGRRVTRE